jgi:hypothetical protein
MSVLNAVSMIIKLALVINWKAHGDRKSLVIKDVLPLFWPTPQTSTELCPVVHDWFSMLRTCPAVFHSSISFASAYIDIRNSNQSLGRSPEIIAHSSEAIRQINSALSRNDWSDAIIFAIIGMSKPPEETDLQRKARFELNNTSPFKLHPTSPLWDEKFVHYDLEDPHSAGIRTILKLRGGFDTISCPHTAKCLSL